MKRERARMIFDLPAHIQMAIRLRAVKSQCTTAQVVEDAMVVAFVDDVNAAEKALEELNDE